MSPVASALHAPGWHAHSAEGTLRALGASAAGLSHGEADARLLRHGRNELARRREVPRLRAAHQRGEALVILVAVVFFPVYDGVPLLSRFVAVRTVYVGVLRSGIAVALFLLAFDAPPAGRATGHAEVAEAQTLAVTSVALFQIFYLVLCRTLTHPLRSVGLRSNPTIFAGIATLLLLQAAFVQLPFMHELFGTASLSAGQWLVAAAAAAVVVPVVAAEKAWRARRSVTRCAAAG